MGGIIWKINVNKQGDIFVGTDGCGIYKSTNEGESWVEANSGVTDLITMSIDFNSAGHIYIGSNQGNIFKSIDNGVSWTHIKGGLTKVYSLVINDSDVIFATSYSGSVFRSTDDGENWTELNSGLTNLQTFRIVINNSGHLFVGTRYGGIFRSQNNGDSWTDSNEGLTSLNIRCLTVDDLNNIYVGTLDAGIFRSQDNGNSWNAINSGVTDLWIYCLYVNSSGALLAGTLNGMYKSTDQGDNWTLKNAGLYEPRTVSISCSATNIYLGTNNGVFRSSDGGENFIPKNNDLDIRGSIWSLATSYSGDIFAGTCAGSIFRSTDQGNEWNYVSSGFNLAGGIYSMCINSDGHIFADFCGSGIIRSEDNGNTWIQTGSLSGYARSIAFSENSGSLFAGTTWGVFKSLNSGVNWSEMILQPGIPCLFIDTQGYIYAGDNGGNIYKSIDDGQNWDEYVIANVGGVTDIAQDISGLFYVSILGGGVYKSEDNGITWIELNTGLQNTQVYALIFDGDSDLYAGTYGSGVFKLDKRNNQWDSFNNGLTNLYVLSLALDSEKNIYVGTDGGGVFRSVELTTAYNNPESAVYDPTRDCYFVSNKGDGKIIKVDVNNTSTKSVLNSDLTSVRGLCIMGNTLVAAADEGVVFIALPAGTVLQTVAIPGMGFLNDVTWDDTQYVYVSDAQTGMIYKINKDDYTYSTLATGLSSPNGLYYDGANNRLINVPMITNAPILAISLSDGAVTTLKTTTLSNPDGIARNMLGEWYISYWGVNTSANIGTIHKFASDFSGDPLEVSSPHAGPADIFFRTLTATGKVIDAEDAKANTGVLVIPNFNGNTVNFLSLTNLSNYESEVYIPHYVSLKQNYPNPFNPITTINYQLLNQSDVVITIYDISGRKVRELINGNESAGYKSVMWNSRDDYGQMVSGGAYFYNLQTGDYNQTRKMILLK